MARRRVEIAVAPPFRELVSRTWLRRAVLRTLDVAFPGRACQVSLALADDQTVRDVNRRYRGRDETTDVLAFAPGYPGLWEGDGSPRAEASREAPFVLPPEAPPMLGEVVVSYPQAQRQARAVGHPVGRELALLVAHGVLHLLGYDHPEGDEKGAMKELEEKALHLLLRAGGR